MRAGKRLAPGTTVSWAFGAAKGEAKADAQGVVTIPMLKITAEPATLTVKNHEVARRDDRGRTGPGIVPVPAAGVSPRPRPR